MLNSHQVKLLRPLMLSTYWDLRKLLLAVLKMHLAICLSELVQKM